MIISPDILKEFKERMKGLSDEEDDNLIRILSASVEDLREKCGEHDLGDESFKELVFERSRYAYNDALEFFNANFKDQINHLGIREALKQLSTEGEQDATV